MTIDIATWGDRFNNEKIRDREYKMNPKSYIFYVGNGGPKITVSDNAFEYSNDKTALNAILNEWIDSKPPGDHVLTEANVSGVA